MKYALPDGTEVRAPDVDCDQAAGQFSDCEQFLALARLPSVDLAVEATSEMEASGQKSLLGPLELKVDLPLEMGCYAFVYLPAGSSSLDSLQPSFATFDSGKITSTTMTVAECAIECDNIGKAINGNSDTANV